MSAIAGILLAHFAAVPAAVMVLVTAGMAGANIYAGSMMLTAALEKKQNSLNMQEHKQAARFFAESIAKIGVNVLMLVGSLVQTGKAVRLIKTINQYMNTTHRYGKEMVKYGNVWIRKVFVQDNIVHIINT